jgi:2-succinyl-6-hydroxy-2,4-cyclohexadiene-1-carboxylate synthase
MTFKLKIDNYWFSYCLDGDPRYPAILFLHGFMGDRLEFQPAIANLSQQFYCVAIDLPSHGRTDLTNKCTDQFTYQDSCYSQNSCYTIELTAKLIVEFLELLHIERCFLVGYSMGGRVALYLTINFPKYFCKVVLESASAGLLTASERSDRLAKDQQLAEDLELLDHDEFRLFLENWYQQKIFGNLRSHSNFPQLLEHRLQNSPRELAKSLRYLSTGMQQSIWEDLPNNEIPLLLLVGGLDTKFVQINQLMAQASKFSQLEIISNCGHNIHFENPSLFVEKVQAFLR